MLLYNCDNLLAMEQVFYKYNECVDLIYADCIYENTNFRWVYRSLRLLKPNGIFIVQTDHHTVSDYYNLLSIGFLCVCLYTAFHVFEGLPVLDIA